MDQQFEAILEKYVGCFHRRELNCAEAVLCVMNEYFSLGLDAAPRIATAFGGGICSRQSVCGALTGGLMAIGLKYGREVGGDRMPCYDKGEQLLREMEKRLGSIDCRDITGVDFADPAVRAAFSETGGGHDTICEPLVKDVCRCLREVL